jgi:Domain of unknown function (DUF4381)
MEPTKLPLKDIHLPEAISWWPPALGWWLLAVLLPLLIYLIYRLVKRITRKTAIKSAKKVLLQIKQDKQLDNKQKLDELSILIRRVAISTTERNECAGLTGHAWLEYLDRSIKGTPFTQGIGRLLSDAPYRQNMPTEQEIVELTGLCETWLKAQTKRKK